MLKNTPHDTKETTVAEKIGITQNVIPFHINVKACRPSGCVCDFPGSRGKKKKKKSEVCLNKDADLATSESNKREYVSICLPALE